MSSSHSADWVTTTATGDVALALAAAAVLVMVCRRLRQPAVVGEIVAGLMLGPSLLGLLPGDLPKHIFPPEVRPHLSMVAEVGLLLFMFLVGWEFDSGALRGRRRTTGTIWLSAILVPFACGLGLAALIYGSNDVVGGDHISRLNFSLFMGTSMAIAGLPVIARIVTDQRLHLSRVGILGLTLAALDDVLAWCLLAVVSALVTASGASGFLKIVGWGAFYVCVMLWVVRPALRYLAARFGRQALPYAAVLGATGALTSAYVTSEIGLHAIFGAFVFGLIMPRGKEFESLRTAALPTLEHVSSLLLPIYFVVTGLTVDVTQLSGTAALQMVLIIVVACACKITGVMVPARLSGTGWRDSTLLALLMNTRGLTQLVILNTGYDLGLLSVQLFTALTVMALTTTAMTAPLMSALLKRAQRRPGGAADPVPLDAKEAASDPTVTRRSA